MDAGDDEAPPSGHQALEELADWYWSVAELDPDEVNPDDHAAILVRAFTASHCGPFAWALSGITGWQTLNAVSPTRGPLHSLVRAPDGRMLDAAGWVTGADLARRYGVRRLAIVEAPREGVMGLYGMEDLFETETGDLYDEELARLVSAIRVLPHAPFSDPGFAGISGRPVPGVDVPMPPRPVDDVEAGISLPYGRRP